jgi:hypothetical protein
MLEGRTQRAGVLVQRDPRQRHSGGPADLGVGAVQQRLDVRQGGRVAEPRDAAEGRRDEGRPVGEAALVLRLRRLDQFQQGGQGQRVAVAG